MKFLLFALLIMAGLYLLVVVVLALGQRGMIYHPDPTRAEPGDVDVPEMVPVPLRAEDGWPVSGWYAPPRNPEKPTVVFFHGNSGTIGSRAFKARALLDAGHGVFLLEYRGYGGMPGQPSEVGLYADARAALRWLLGRGIPAQRLVLYGESLGAGVAVEMARQFPPQKLILECPFTSLMEMAPPYVLPPLARMVMVDRYDNLSKMAEITMPLLLIHGEKDQTVPASMGRALLEAARSEVKEGVFLPAAHHNDLWEHGAGERVIEFIGRSGRD